MPNRVEELEGTVSELEATVEGLTEELVETKERVRTLEATLAERQDDAPADGETTDQSEEVREADPDEVRQAAAEADKRAGDGEPDDDGDDEGIDDIIVA